MSTAVIHECVTLKVNEKPVTADIVVYGVYENDYGADADGNRGVAAWFIEDYEYVVPDVDDEGHKLSDEEHETLKGMVQDFIENNDWDFAEEHSHNLDDEDYSVFDDSG